MADVFVLPSFSENFGVVVAEALAYGVPVIATLGTPWKGLVATRLRLVGRAWRGCAGDALSQAMTLSDEERNAMGVRGQKYARQFDWSHIPNETADVYRWLLGQADRRIA